MNFINSFKSCSNWLSNFILFKIIVFINLAQEIIIERFSKKFLWSDILFGISFAVADWNLTICRIFSKLVIKFEVNKLKFCKFISESINILDFSSKQEEIIICKLSDKILIS